MASSTCCITRGWSASRASPRMRCSSRRTAATAGSSATGTRSITPTWTTLDRLRASRRARRIDPQGDAEHIRQGRAAAAEFNTSAARVLLIEDSGGTEVMTIRGGGEGLHGKPEQVLLRRQWQRLRRRCCGCGRRHRGRAGVPHRQSALKVRVGVMQQYKDSVLMSSSGYLHAIRDATVCVYMAGTTTTGDDLQRRRRYRNRQPADNRPRRRVFVLCRRRPV